MLIDGAQTRFAPSGFLSLVNEPRTDVTYIGNAQARFVFRFRLRGPNQFRKIDLFPVHKAGEMELLVVLHKGFGEQHERPVSGVDRASGIDLGLPTLDQIQTVVQPVNERTAVDDVPNTEMDS